MAIITGTNSNNTLNGTNQADDLFGLEGDDILLGGGGADRLNGGEGADALQGGAGNDTYVYTSVSDSTPTSRDVILDFAMAERIDLSAIGLRLVWAGTTPRAYGVWYAQADGNTYVWADVDGDTEPEFSLQIVGIFNLTATQFIGLNAAPDIRAASGDAASRTVAETDGALVASGTLTVTDVDLADTVTVAVGSVSVSGTTGGHGPEAFLGMLNVVAAQLTADPGQVNNVPWVFDSGAENFDFLARGESLTLTYTVTATDSATPLGATDAQTVTVRITGTNDAPDVQVGTGDVAAASLAVSGTGLSAAGTLTVMDADLSNTVTATVTGVVASGPTPGLSATQLRSFLTVTAGALAADPGSSGNLGWNFNSGSQAFQFVGEGQTLLLSYTVRVTDTAGATDTEVVTITIAGSNDAPVLATATARSYTENAAPVVINGSLTVTDVDSTTFAYATVAITGGFAAGQDVLSFENTNATTYGDIQAVYDFASGVLTLESADGTATKAQWQAALRAVRYSNTSDDPATTGRVISFQIDDGGSQNSLSNVLNSTVSITPRNDAPTVGALAADVATASIAVAGSALVATGTLSVADPDAADTVTAEVIGVTTSGPTPGLLAAQLRGLLTVTGGALAADPGSSGNLGWDFNAAAQAFGFVGEGQTLVLRYTIRVRDNNGATATATEVVTITITGGNDAPVLAGATARAYTENAAPVVVNNALTLADVDSTTFASATVAITGGFDAGQDVLSFTSAAAYGDITASYDAATGVLTLESAGGTATKAQWQAALRAVRYANTSEDPVLTDRVVSFQIDDGGAGNNLSNVLTSTLSITARNDAPTVGALPGDVATASIAVSGPALAASGTLSVADPDAADTVTAEVTGVTASGPTTGLSATQLRSFLTVTQGALAADPGSSGNLGWDFNATAQAFGFLAEGQTLVLSYTIRVRDNTGATATANQVVSITITGGNDAPVLANSTQRSYTENGAPLVINGSLTVTDVDSATLARATVSITDGFVAGQDLLSFTSSSSYGNITASYEAASGVLTLESAGGTATKAQWQAALRTVRYSNSSDDPSTVTRTISFQIDDGHVGSGLSNILTSTVSITAVNDAPVAGPVTLAPLGVNSGPRIITQAELLANATDVDGPSLSITGLTRIAGTGTLVNNGNGTWTYTPVAGDTSEVQFRYTVSDGSRTATGTATLDLVVNTAPVAANASLLTQEDAAFSGTLPTASDADGDAVTYALGIGPAHGVAVVNTDGSFSYTPAADYNGPDAFTFTISDGRGGSNTYTVNLTVTPVNDPASIAGVTSGAVAEDGTLTAGGVLGVSDVDAGEAVVEAQSDVTGTYGVFGVTADGVWTYQLDNAAANVQSLAQGQSVSDLFTVTSADGTATQQITVTVTGSNDAPTAGGFAASTSKDTLLEGTLPAAQDVDGDAVTYALAAQASHGAAIVNADGSYSYTPTAGFSGADAFSYSVSDGNGGSNTYAVEVNVIAENHAPVLAGAAFVMNAGDGIVTTDMGGSEWGRGVAVQPDGRIVMAGYSIVGGNADFALARYNADGTRDASFGGGDGIVTTHWFNDDQGFSVALQPDGKIVVAGRANFGFALARYNADGTLDTSFGSGGVATTPVGSGAAFGFSVALQPDGRIVVAGYGASGGNTDFALVRYNADGALDASFGSGGIVTTPVGAGTDIGQSVALQPDGKIVVAGYGIIGGNDDFALVRYNADGTLDTSFGGDGIVTLNIGGADLGYSVALQPDGKIVVAGSGGGAIALVRYDADGTLDASFGGGDGIVTTSGGTGYSVALQPDGRIVVAGSGGSAIALVRYNADGTPDASFGGGDGIVTTPLGIGGMGYSVALQPDGRIVVAGHITIGGNQDFVLVRYNADGTLDTSFDGLNLVNEGAPFSFTLPAGRFVDQDGDALAFTATLADGSAPPAWLSFDAATLTFSGTAPAGAPDLALRVTATDPGGLSVSDIIVLHTQSPPNSAPVGADASLELAEDTALDGTLPVATDADGDVVMYALGSSPAHGTAVVNADGTFSYTPAENYNGLDAFTFVVTDGNGGSNTYTVNLTVSPVNDDATIDGVVTGTVAEDGATAASGVLAVTDVDAGEAALVSQMDTAGIYGVFSADAAGAWTYQLANDAANVQALGQGESVTDTFTVTSVDGTASRQIVITINGANDAPVAADASVATLRNVPATGSLPAATDVDGDALTYALATGAGHGVAVVNADGSYSYTPAIDYVGSDAFTYVVTDSNGAANLYTVTVEVALQNRAPVVANPVVAIGIVTTPIGPGTNYDEGRRVTVQPDGKILVAGYAQTTAGGADFALARYNADGTLDGTFGGGDGIVTTPIGPGTGSDLGYSVTVQPDGKILVAGYAQTTAGGADFALARYNADGTLDGTFGDGDGIVITPIGPGTNYEEGRSVTVQPDGKILVAGLAQTATGGTDFALARYNADGTLDGTFGGGDGIVTTPIGPGTGSDLGYSVTVQPDGKILVAGYAQTTAGGADFALARYNADGTLDGTFGGGDGIVTTPIGPGTNSDVGYGVTVQPDGKILVAGYAQTTTGGTDFALARYNADGTLDGTFGGGDGIVTTPIGPGSNSDQGYSVTVQPDGKILVAGYAQTTAGGADFALARYNANGTLDGTFGGGDGIVTTPIGPGTSSELGYSVAVQADGKILVAGRADLAARGSDFALVRYNADGTLDRDFRMEERLHANESSGFSYTIPADLFSDPDGDSLTLSAVQANGDPLPAWLSFDAANRTFSGVAPAGSSDVTVQVTATDPGGLSTRYTYVIHTNAPPTLTGIVTTAIGSGSLANVAHSVVTLADGKFVVAGYSQTAAGGQDFTVVRYNPDGSVDTSFGEGDGVAITAVSPASGADVALSMVTQPDGKLIVVGYAQTSSGGQDVALVRYNADGTLDTSFGNQGIAITSIGTNADAGLSVAVQSDGRIVVSGYAWTSTGGQDIALLRYTSDGNLDTSFGGGDGIVTTAVSPGGLSDAAYSIAILADGKYLVAGFANSPASGGQFLLARYNSDGTLDSGFGGGDGISLITPPGTTFGSAYSLVVQPDGRILVSGLSATPTGDGDFLLARFNPDGTVDSSFGGGDGFVTTAIGTSSDEGRSVVLQPDGKILVAGYGASSNGGFDFAVVRYLSDGSLDLGFGGGDGVVTTPISQGSGTDLGYSIALQPDGRILVAGYVQTSSGGVDFGIVRYNADGSLDSTFGGVTFPKVSEGQGFSYQIPPSAFTDADDTQLTYSVALADGSAAPAWLNVSGSFVFGTPPPGTGDLALLLTATDPHGVSVSLPVTLLVNRAPQAANLSVTVAEDSSLSGSLPAATDPEGAPVTYALAIGPSNGSVVVNSDGTFSYVPRADFNGSDSFGYRITDGEGGIGTYTVNVTVEPRNDAPVALITAGVVTTPVSPGINSDVGRSVTVQPDGKILVAGFARTASGADDFALVRYNADGTLDGTFGGGDGIVTTPIGPGGNSDQGYSVAVQADGKILVAGYAQTATGGADFALARYQADGTLDDTFGGGDGIVTTPVGPGANSDQGYSVAVQADGKILVAGYAQTATGGADFALVRYNTDGTLDDTFGGGDGIVTTPIGPGTNSDQGYSVAVQPDGKILVAGFARTASGADDFALVRYNADGTLDGTFGGGDGIVTTPIIGPGGNSEQGYSVTVQPDGKILVAGIAQQTATGGTDFALARYNADGTLDGTFGGGDGIVTTPISPGINYEEGRSVTVQPDGKILVAGLAQTATGGTDFALARYNADGTLDGTFGGGDGIVTTPIGPGGNSDQGYSVAVQPDGKILVAGYTYTTVGREDFALVRYNADGSLDTTFGGVQVPAANAGQAYSYTLPSGLFSDIDGDALTLSVTLVDGSAAPAWLTLSGNTLTGTPPAGSADLALRLVATDPSGASASIPFFLHVEGSAENTAPVSTNLATDAVEDTVLNGALPVATDADGDAVTYALGTGPAHGAAVVNADGSFSYTPAENYNGDDAFTFLVTDGNGGGNSYTVSLTVVPVNDPASIAGVTSGAVVEDGASAAGGALVVTDVDVGETAVAPQADVAGTFGAFSVTGDGAWTYQLDNAAVGVQSLAQGQSVSDTFTVVSIDGTATQQVTVSISGTNDAPTIEPAQSAATGGESIGGTAAGSDVDAGAVLTYAATQGANGIVSIDAGSGAWTYTPAAGFFGADSFVITVSDQWGASAQQAVTVTVFDTNQAPEASNASVSTLEDAVLNGTLPAATDADGDAVTYALASPATHGVAAVNGDGSFTYTPVADYHGADSFTYSINDGRGGTNSYTVSVTVDPVNDAASIAGAATGAVTEDGVVSASGALTVTDVDEGEAAIVALADISGEHGSFSVTAAGAWSYQLDNAAASVQALAQGQSVMDVFTVSSLDGTATRQVTITVSGANDAPTIVASASATTQEEASAAGVAVGADVDGGAVLSYTAADGLHGAVVIDAGTGAWTYTPEPNFAGNDSFVVTVRDQFGAEAQQTVTVTVENVNDAPVAANVAIEATEDTVFNGTLPAATDVDGDGVTYALGAAAAHGTVVVNANGSFSYAPAANYNGPDSFTYVVSDGHGGSNVYPVAVSVAAVNDAASISGAASGSVAEDGVTSAAGSLSVTDPDAGEAGIVPRSNVAGSYGLFSIAAAGAWTYVLDNAAAGVQSLAQGETVTDSFLVASVDGTASQQVTLTITGTNDVPTIAASVSVSTLEEVTAGGTAAGGDVDGGAVLTYAVGTATHGTVTIDAASGVWSYTPALDYAGSDSFVVTVTDQWGAIAQQSVSVSVANVNDAPVAFGASISLAEDAIYASALPPASDVDGDTVTYALDTDAAHGTAIVNADGSFSYTPVADYNGSDSFTYAVSDGQGGSNTYTVQVTVTPVNDAPVAANASIVTPEDTRIEGMLPAASDVDGDVATYALTTPATHGLVIIGADGSYDYRPASNYYGSDSFGYTVSDGQGGSNSYTVSVTVEPVNDAPTAANVSVGTIESTPISGLLPVATDVEGDTITYALASNPAHGVASVSPDGTYSYTPVTNYHGTDTFQYSVIDAHGAARNYTVTVAIQSVNSGPTIGEHGTVPGIVTTAIRLGSTIERGRNSVLLPDGKIMVVAYSQTATNVSQTALIRYNADGSVDTSFGGDDSGVVILSSAAFSFNQSSPISLGLQPDGKFLVASSFISTNGYDLARFNADGTLDTTFGGGDGISQVPIFDSGSTNYYIQVSDLAVLPDGRILLSGDVQTTGSTSSRDFALVFFNSDGSLDASIGGGNGYIVPAVAGQQESRSLVVLPDGGYLIAGRISSGITIARYNSDGTLDPAFGAGQGYVTTTVPGSSGGDAVLAVQSDGKLLIATNIAGSSVRDFALLRYNADGTPDATFGGGDGILDLEIGGWVVTTDLVMQPDGKILVAGRVSTTNGNDFGVIRFDANGNLDATFGGGDGIAITAIAAGSGWDEPFAIQLQPDGRILLIGYTTVGSSNDDIALVRYNADGTLDESFRAEERLDVSELSAFSYVVPAARFADPDGDALTLSVVQRDGNPLPEWLDFDAGTRTLSGTPPLLTPELALRVVATDPDGESIAYDLWLHTNSPPTPSGIVTTDAGQNSGNDVGRAVVALADGRVLVAGTDGTDLALMRYHADGSLDSSFGRGGIVITPIGAGGSQIAESVAVQQDGRILVAGRGASGTGGNVDVVLVRYNVDGTLDTGFGGDGIVTTQIINSGGEDNAYRVSVLPDGYILVGGHTASFDFALLRYNPDGSLDEGFDGGANGNGIVTTPVGTSTDRAYDMVVLEDGSAVLAGQAQFAASGSDVALVRYNADGTLDTSFGGGDGIVTTAIASGTGIDQANAIAVQADGKLVVVGQTAGAGTGNDALVLRYNPDGTLDTTFGGGDGIVTLALPGATGSASSPDIAHGVVIQPDGRIVVVGESDSRAIVVRYNVDGSLDGTFGNAGVVLLFDTRGVSNAYDVTLQPDGRILVTGIGGMSGNDTLVARLNSDGSFDPSFGGFNLPKVNVGASFSIALNLNNLNRTPVFIDADGDAMTYNVTMADGSAPPAWLAVNVAGTGVTLSLAGTPPAGATDLLLRLVATDSMGASGSVPFVLAMNNDPTDIQWNAVAPPSGSALPASSVVIANLTATDPDGDAIMSWINVSGLSVNTAGAVTAGTLAANTTYARTARVTDQFGDSYEETFHVITGSAGSDTLLPVGGEGDPILAGDDIIYALGGSDVLFGGAGNDTLFGQDGDDILHGGTGNDVLHGGAGNDIFVFANDSGADRIAEFTAGLGAGDVIDLSGVTNLDWSTFADVQEHATQAGADTVIDLGDGNTITLVGVAVGSLAADDFLL